MKSIISTTLLCSTLSLTNPLGASENKPIQPLSEQVRGSIDTVLKEHDKKEEVVPVKDTITIDTRILKKSALAKKGISPSLASFLGENQVERIITTHNPKLREKHPTEKRIVYSEIDSLKMPLVFDDLKNVFPAKLEDFLEANPKFGKEKERLDNSGIFVVRIRETDRYALAYYQEGVLRLATHSSPGKKSGTSKWKNGKILAGGIKTPEGVFTIGYKEANKTSRAFENAPMPYALNVNGWIFIHTGRVDGTPLSHGCIRIPGLYAKELFGMVPLGTKVIVSFDGVSRYKKEADIQKTEGVKQIAQN